MVIKSSISNSYQMKQDQFSHTTHRNKQILLPLLLITDLKDIYQAMSHIHPSSLKIAAFIHAQWQNRMGVSPIKTFFTRQRAANNQFI